MSPRVSVVIPCRNEERYIVACLRSLLDGGYPPDKLELLVVDGQSTDCTRALIEEAVASAPEIVRLLDNVDRVMSAGANLGIREATGDVIFVLNGHSTYSSGYLQTCVDAMEEYGADCVGGVVGFADHGASPFGSAIRVAMSHPFGVGGARYKTGVAKPTWVDTPGFPGCRREVFERAGMYDESLRYSQDYELFGRASTQGFRHLVHPGARAMYQTRDSFSAFVRYSWRNGEWISVPMRLMGAKFALRHFVPASAAALGLGLVLAGLLWRPAWWVLAALVVTHLALALAVSAAAAARRRDPLLLLTGPVTFFTMHAVMGAGTLWGFVRPIGAERRRRTSHGGPPRLARRVEGSADR